MNQAAQVVAPAASPVSQWIGQPFEKLFSLPRSEVERVQREALIDRFQYLRPKLTALDKLATRQGVEQINNINDVVPVMFDHQVYKSYPISLIEKRDFARLTSWLQRLTLHDLTSVPLAGLDSVDAWLERLDQHGMIVGHSTGTSGKLSFIPRSKTEWPAWISTYFEGQRAATGVDPRKVRIPNFSPNYRDGHQMMTKMGRLFGEASAGGEKNRYTLYNYKLSSDFLSLAGRLKGAEERGELDKLQIDPKILAERKHLIEASRHRDDDLQRWFAKLAEDYRGQRVCVGGTSGDLVRIALKGKEAGIVCQFSPDSLLVTGGGMKGFKGAPADWEQFIQDFFGITPIRSMYGMSECMGSTPMCSAGYYHFFPHTIPLVLDEDSVPLPTEGVQTGRMALFDLLAETYWGGFISGDRVTMHWDYACPCGWKGARISRDVVRFSEIQGGDDKISCAGTAEAYGDFMDYVSQV